MPNRVYDGVLLDKVYVVLDISSQTEDVPANDRGEVGCALAEPGPTSGKLKACLPAAVVRCVHSGQGCAHLGNKADTDMLRQPDPLSLCSSSRDLACSLCGPQTRTDDLYIQEW